MNNKGNWRVIYKGFKIVLKFCPHLDIYKHYTTLHNLKKHVIVGTSIYILTIYYV